MIKFLHEAIILVEDRRFFHHFGIDPFAIARAFLINLKERRYAQGGSTITQQLARTKYLHRRKTLFRKITEIFLAFYIEVKYNKQEILGMYMDEVYMGQDVYGRPIYGFTAAARNYFNADLDQLTYAEAAALVAMVKGPNLYRPNSKSGVARRTMILGIMLDQDLLTPPQMFEAVENRTL